MAFFQKVRSIFDISKKKCQVCSLSINHVKQFQDLTLRGQIWHFFWRKNHLYERIGCTVFFFLLTTYTGFSECQRLVDILIGQSFDWNQRGWNGNVSHFLWGHQIDKILNFANILLIFASTYTNKLMRK